MLIQNKTLPLPTVPGQQAKATAQWASQLLVMGWGAFVPSATGLGPWSWRCPVPAPYACLTASRMRTPQLQPHNCNRTASPSPGPDRLPTRCLPCSYCPTAACELRNAAPKPPPCAMMRMGSMIDHEPASSTPCKAHKSDMPMVMPMAVLP